MAVESAADSNVTVRAMASSETAAAAAVLNDALGEGAVSEEEMTGVDGPPSWGRTFVAVRGPEVVGAAVAAAVPAAAVMGYVPQAVRVRVAAGLPEAPWVATLHALAVSPDARGRGVGERLTRASAEWAAAQGARYVFALAWADADGCHAAKALERSGYAAVDAIPDVWYADSTELCYECPSCGRPCRCSAVVYVRELT